MVYFRCTSSGSGKGNTVIVTCAEQFAGVAVTIAKIGKSYTKVCPLTAPYVIKFYGLEAGTYTVSATVSGQTYSTEVIVQDVSCVLNYGFTWKLWVDTASKLDSSDYASLSEVLADEEAVRELFTEHACVDYMADSTSSNADLETIIENDLCAKWINNSDYALDFLEANTIIKSLMDAADKYGYGEWVNNNGTWGPKGNVPVMTANTAPYGEVSATNTYSGYYPYSAFNGSVSNNGWLPADNTAGRRIVYKFTNPIRAKKATVYLYYAGGTLTKTLTGKIVGSNDGTTWKTLSSAVQATSDHKWYNIPCSTSDADAYYLYIGYEITSGNASDLNGIKLQFYGRSLSVSVPTMTSNTAPFGTIIYDRVLSNYDGYKAFDNNDSTWYQQGSSEAQTTDYIGYEFTKPIRIGKVHVKRANNSTTESAQAFVVEGYNGTSWVAISDEEEFALNTAEKDIVCNSTSAYSKARLRVVNPGVNCVFSITTLQFYGLDYSEKEFEVGTTKKWLYDHGVELETLVLTKGSSGGVLPVNNGSSIELESGSVSSSFSRVGILYDLSNFGLIRAKIGKFITVGNSSVAIEVENTDYSSELAIRYINTANDLPNNEYLDISNINQQCYAEFVCGSAKSAKVELTEFWLE